jgi:hypothetical protein
LLAEAQMDRVGEHAIDDPGRGQNLECPRLQCRGASLMMGLGCALYYPGGHPVAGQLDGGKQTRGPGTTTNTWARLAWITERKPYRPAGPTMPGNAG